MKSTFMRSRFAKPALFLLALSLACAVPQLSAKKKPAANHPGPNEQKRAAHALNRLAFGPRPGDVQKVMAMGVDQWIDVQLHPEKISDSAIDARLARFRTLRMSSRELVEEFPDNQMIKQVMDGKKVDAVRSGEARGLPGADCAYGRKEGAERRKSRSEDGSRRSRCNSDSGRCR